MWGSTPPVRSTKLCHARALYCKSNPVFLSSLEKKKNQKKGGMSKDPSDQREGVVVIIFFFGFFSLQILKGVGMGINSHWIFFFNAPLICDMFLCPFLRVHCIFQAVFSFFFFSYFSFYHRKEENSLISHFFSSLLLSSTWRILAPKRGAPRVEGGCLDVWRAWETVSYFLIEVLCVVQHPTSGTNPAKWGHQIPSS